MVPHLPPTEFGFNHAGNEVWQKNAGDDLTVLQCANAAGKAENTACADSILATGTDAHLRYLAVIIGSQCTSYQLKHKQQSFLE